MASKLAHGTQPLAESAPCGSRSLAQRQIARASQRQVSSLLPLVIAAWPQSPCVSERIQPHKVSKNSLPTGADSDTSVKRNTTYKSLRWTTSSHNGCYARLNHCNLRLLVGCCPLCENPAKLERLLLRVKLKVRRDGFDFLFCTSEDFLFPLPSRNSQFFYYICPHFTEVQGP